MNPLQLAVSLHWNPEDPVAARDVDAKRVLDHWLQQIEHFDPIFAPEYVEAPALLSELFIEETGHGGRMARVEEDGRFHHGDSASISSPSRSAPSRAVPSWRAT